MHQDIELIHDEIAQIDGLVIPAHILAHTPSATSVFVSSIHDHSYYIDPMTFLLQSRKRTHSGSSAQMRASVRKMCEGYNADLIGRLANLKPGQSFQARDFTEMDGFCEGVIAFQQEMVETNYGDSKAAKYLKRYGRTEVTQPRFLVPPYFCAAGRGDDWYDLSLNCANECIDLCDELPVPIVSLPASSLNPETSNEIASDYAEFERVVIWLDNFNQIGVPPEDISAASNLIRTFSQNGTATEVLYGGYLFMLMHFDELEAISHGILYTQHKASDSSPGGGGVPDRYYIPKFHEFRSLSQTDLIIHQHPELMCDCEICSELLQDDPDNFILFRDEPELLKRHFLAVRKNEAETIVNSELEPLLRELRSTYNKYHESIRVLRNPDAVKSRGPMEGLQYLENWRRGLSA